MGKSKSKGQHQQLAGSNPTSSSQSLPSSSQESGSKRGTAQGEDITKVTSPAKRAPPRERTSPSPGSKSKRSKNTTATPSLAMLAAVEGLEENAPDSGAPNPVLNESSAGSSNPYAIESSSETHHTNAEKEMLELPGSSRSSSQRKETDAAGVNSDSTGKGKDSADDNSDSSGIKFPASSRSRRQRKGQDAAGVSSDNAGKGKDEAGDISDSSVKGKDVQGVSSESDDSDSDITPPTPVKKPYGIDRVQRGRKIKASSPAGRKNPPVPVLTFCWNFCWNY